MSSRRGVVSQGMNAQLLTGKTAVIYGGGGNIGGAVARAFAREGAQVHVAGRTREPLERVAADTGAHVAVLDAADEAAVDAHAAEIGRIDISFNLALRGDAQGTPLVEMEVGTFLHAIELGTRTAFLTSRAAARRMDGGGVILFLTSGSSRGTQPGMGNTGPTDAAVEALYRYQAAELGPRGIRVAGIHTAAVRGTLTAENIEATGGQAIDPELIYRMVGERSMLGRVPTLDEIAETAAFLASDRAGALTSGIVNATCGLVAG
jgi:NAD(P)-dependent dehydrogenase (short-subunit alcohol dehydrogenase family)